MGKKPGTGRENRAPKGVSVKLLGKNLWDFPCRPSDTKTKIYSTKG
jgi:hypothetical protein